MATNTYIALETQTVASPVAYVEFTNINQTYTDLVLVVNMQSSYTNDAGNGARLQFNGDNGTGNLYSNTNVRGTTTNQFSYRLSNSSYLQTGLLPSSGGGTPAGTLGIGIINIPNYSNTTLNKIVLSRTNSIYASVEASIGLWRNTNAITSIKYFGDGNILAGSTFSLYGIKAWTNETTPKATGGYVYEDSTYYYHSFPFSGTFTPNQSLTTEVLCVAGGGGAAQYYGGGGGAGGYVYSSSYAVTATNYTVTVGAGGVGLTNGGNTSFTGLTTAVGGGAGAPGGGGTGSAGNGGSGGGGGSGSNTTGGTGTAGQGFAGGNSAGTAGTYASGGGGGATTVGANVVNTSSPGGNGGTGLTSSFINALGAVTGLGHFVSGSYYFAGGGGGGAGVVTNNQISLGGNGGGGDGGVSKPDNTPFTLPKNGMVSTGGGAGGGGGSLSTNYPAGGSGIVIVRYAK